MRNIYDAFSEITSKYVDFYMNRMEFEEAWKKVTKEMSRKYKTRGKELCSSKSFLEEVMDWFKIGKTRREEELEEKVKELEETIKEHKRKEDNLNARINELERKLVSKDKFEEASRGLKKKLDRVEERLKEYEKKRNRRMR